MSSPVVGVIMGSQSDWPVMENACKILEEFNIPYEAKVISAHRTPARAHDYATTLSDRGVKVLIAGAGMAAHLAGVMASLTHIPVLGVPIESKVDGMDALLATVQMPGGIPVGTLAIGNSGAKNAALLAVSMLALSDKKLEQAYLDWRQNQSDNVPESPF
ncbi:MAG: 5-(carboxyamino)imidazole ribonucleotide mutase [Alphaproteobacteria bacterium]